VVGPLKDNNGQLVSESCVICEIMNEYFGSVFTPDDLVNELPETKCKFSTDNDHMLSNIEITRDIVLNKLNKLNSNKAPGVDSDFFQVIGKRQTLRQFSRRVIKPHHVIIGLLA